MSSVRQSHGFHTRIRCAFRESKLILGKRKAASTDRFRSLVHGFFFLLLFRSVYVYMRYSCVQAGDLQEEEERFIPLSRRVVERER